MRALLSSMLLGLLLTTSCTFMVGCGGGGNKAGNDPAAKGEPVMDNVPDPAP